MFMLNLLFDFAREDGLFRGDASGSGGNPLRRSKNWLKLRAAFPEPAAFPPFPGVPPLPFDPDDTVKWSNVGDAESGSLHLPHTVVEEGNIGVRVAHHPDSSFPFILANGRVQLAVCFGRPTMPNQQIASPFSSPFIKTTFIVSDGLAGNGLPANTPAGWFFHVGLVNKRPSQGGEPATKNTARRFEYSVGIIVKHPNSAGQIVERHYSLDPEMDIGPEP